MWDTVLLSNGHHLVPVFCILVYYFSMKRLHRSKQNKVLGGVSAGLAEYFDQDPVLWRIGAIVLFILTGFMPLALIYALAWLIIPENSGGAYTVPKEPMNE